MTFEVFVTEAVVLAAAAAVYRKSGDARHARKQPRQLYDAHSALCGWRQLSCSSCRSCGSTLLRRGSTRQRRRRWLCFLCDVICDVTTSCCLCCSALSPGIDLDLAPAAADDDWLSSAVTRDIIFESIPAVDSGWWHCTKRDIAFNLVASAERLFFDCVTPSSLPPPLRPPSPTRSQVTRDTPGSSRGSCMTHTARCAAGDSCRVTAAAAAAPHVGGDGGGWASCATSLVTLHLLPTTVVCVALCRHLVLIWIWQQQLLMMTG